MGSRFDCSVSVSAAIPDPPTEESVAVKKLRGTVFYDHRVSPLFLMRLFNQISFRFRRETDTVKLLRNDAFVAVILRFDKTKSIIVWYRF